MIPMCIEIDTFVKSRQARKDIVRMAREGRRIAFRVRKPSIQESSTWGAAIVAFVQRVASSVDVIVDYDDDDVRANDYISNIAWLRLLCWDMRAAEDAIVLIGHEDMAIVELDGVVYSGAVAILAALHDAIDVKGTLNSFDSFDGLVN